MGIVSHDSAVPITREQWAELRRRYPDANRLSAAFALARDVETCAELLRGEQVDQGRLDARELQHAQTQRLVSLNRPIDLLEVETVEQPSFLLFF